MLETVKELVEEQDALDRMLSTLTEEQWDLPTPAKGWTVKDSASHIAFTDEVAVSVLQGDETPLKEAARMGSGYNDIGLKKGRSMRSKEVLEWWKQIRAVMLRHLRAIDPKKRIPWFALPMSPRSFTTARLMETWAHGLDCFDAVGMETEDTDRLRNVAHLAYRAMPYTYAINGLEPPNVPLRLELQAPSGELWTWGPEDAVDRIVGKAGEFCRVAVRRRHWKDTNLKIMGEEALIYISIAQTYAGPSGSGRTPLSEGRDGFNPKG